MADGFSFKTCDYCEKPLRPPFVYTGRLDKEFHVDCAVMLAKVLTDRAAEIMMPSATGRWRYPWQVECTAPLCKSHSVTALEVAELPGPEGEVAHMAFRCAAGHLFVIALVQDIRKGRTDQFVLTGKTIE